MIKANLGSKRGLKLKTDILQKEVVLKMGSLHGILVEIRRMGDVHKVREFPFRDGKQVASNVPKDDPPNKRHFYALRTK